MYRHETGPRPAASRSMRASTQPDASDPLRRIGQDMTLAEEHRRRSLVASLCGLMVAVGLILVGLAQWLGPKQVSARAASVAPEVTQAVPAQDAAVIDAEPPAPPAVAEESAATTPSAPQEEQPRESAAKPATPAQRLRVAIGDVGYEPAVLRARAGVPIELTVERGSGCAAGFVLPSLGIEIDNSRGAATRNLGALDSGEYSFTCSMGMVSGILRVD